MFEQEPAEANSREDELKDAKPAEKRKVRESEGGTAGNRPVSEMTAAPHTGAEQKDAPALYFLFQRVRMLFFHALTFKELCNRHTFRMFHFQT